MPVEANRSYFTPSPRLLTWITKIHRGVYQASNGWLGSVIPQRAEKGRGWLFRGLSTLLLTTTGRKSGVRRTVPLPYYTIEGRVFLVASNAGQEQHPAWYLNLKERPEVEVQMK